MLRRTADDDDPYERVVVANADQLAIVTALADPEPRPRLIDRCLVAAYDGGLDPAARADQVGPGLRRTSCWRCTAPLGVPYVVTSREELADGDAADRVREHLDGRITAFVGHSRRRQDDPGQRAGPEGAPADAPAMSTRSPAAAGTPPPRRSPCRCRATRAAGSSTPRASAPSGCTTSTRPGSSSPSPTWSRAPRAARARAVTTSRTARWTQWVADGHADPARLYSLRRLLATRERREGD